MSGAVKQKGLVINELNCSYLLLRNDWDPPDRKVDTRKFRSEPRSIFEYEPGKSSILEHERPVRDINQTVINGDI